MKKIKVLLVHSMHPEETYSKKVCNKIKEYFDIQEPNFEIHIMDALDKINTNKEFLKQREIKLNLNRYVDFKNLIQLSDNLKNIYEQENEYQLVLDVHNSFNCKNCVLYSYTNKDVVVDLKDNNTNLIKNSEDFFSTNFVKRKTKFQSLATFLREEKNITQLDLALEIGIKSVAFYSNCENNRYGKHFNLEHLYKIAKAFKIPLSSFFEEQSSLAILQTPSSSDCVKYNCFGKTTLVLFFLVFELMFFPFLIYLFFIITCLVIRIIFNQIKR